MTTTTEGEVVGGAAGAGKAFARLRSLTGLRVLDYSTSPYTTGAPHGWSSSSLTAKPEGHPDDPGGHLRHRNSTSVFSTLLMGILVLHCLSTHR